MLDDWGFEKFLAAVEEKLGRQLTRVAADAVKPRPADDRLAHIGVHPQKQPGLYWVGVVLPVGRMTAAQMRASPRSPRRLGGGDIRLTVWQNLLISDIADANVADGRRRIEALGLDWTADAVRAGLVACTGNAGLQVRRRPTPRATRWRSPTCRDAARPSTSRSTST